MVFDDREETGAADRPKVRQLRLPDLLRGPFDIKSVALTGLFILAVFYTMYFMRAMLLPLVLALLLSYLLAPLVRALGHLYIRPPFAAAQALVAHNLSRQGQYASFPSHPGAPACLDRSN